TYAQVVESFQKISPLAGNYSTRLNNLDQFGSSVTSIGDLNGDGIEDVIIGASGDGNEGAIWVLFLNENGSVNSSNKISNGRGNFSHTLEEGDRFGSSVTSLGDLNNDGIPDIAVGANARENMNDNSGSVWILFMNRDGSVNNSQKVGNSQGNFSGTLKQGDAFGSSIVGLGDLDGDGTPDIAVGAPYDDDDGLASGAIWILFLNTDGTVKTQNKIRLLESGQREMDLFGSSLTVLNDLNGDGILDIAIGSPGDDDGGSNKGAVWIGFLNPSGNLIDAQKISALEGGFSGLLNDDDGLGTSLDATEDLDGDGITDLIVGAIGSDDAQADGSNNAGMNRGALWVLFLNQDGTVKTVQKINETSGGFSGNLDNNDVFGSSVAVLGDLDGDSIIEVAVGAIGDDDNGPRRGAVWILSLNSDGTVNTEQKISDSEGGFSNLLNNNDFFGSAVATLSDLDGNGIAELAVGVPGDDDGGLNQGAVWILFMDIDGKVKNKRKISALRGGFLGELSQEDSFGASISSIGDLDGDGIPEIVVGSFGNGIRTQKKGTAWLIFLNTDGSVRDFKDLTSIDAGFAGVLQPGDNFGSSVSPVGDLNGDGVLELVISASGSDDGGDRRGAFWVLFMNSDGSIQSHQKISSTEGGFTGILMDGDSFGASATYISDIDGDGINEIAIGAPQDNNGGQRKGAVWILFLNNDATIKKHYKLGAEQDALSLLIRDGDSFGSSLANIGDLDGDGIDEIAVGAVGDSNGGRGRQGAVWLISLNSDGSTRTTRKISNTDEGFLETLSEGDFFGQSVSPFTDLNNDGLVELVIGARGDDDGGSLGDMGFDSGAVWIIYLNLPATSQGFSNPNSLFANLNEPFLISGIVNDNDQPSLVELIFKRGGESDSLLTVMSQENDSFVGSIPAAFVSERGLEYAVRITDSQRLTTRLPKSGYISTQVQIPNLNYVNPFPDDLVDKYRLISIPLALSDPSPDLILEDDLGSYDKTVWRFFEPKPQEDPNSFKEFPDTSPIVPGKSFWILSGAPVSLIDTGTGLTTPTAVPFSIHLEPGWNYLGNPFTFPIPTDQVYLSSNSERPNHMFSYDGEKWITPVSELLPFEGVIVGNDRPIADTLLIYTTSIDAVEKKAQRRGEDPAAPQWRINISAAGENSEDFENWIVSREESSINKDKFDIPEPPTPPSEFTSLYFPHHNWESSFSRYTIDSRPVSEDGEVWDFEVISNANSAINLTFNGIKDVPQELEIILLDETTTTFQDLRENREYTLPSPGTLGVRKFRVLVGSHKFKQDSLSEFITKPFEYKLHQSFPNPSTGTTSITFTLASSEKVTLEIFDILGKRVTSLLHQEERPAGTHSLTWSSDGHAANGVYFIRIEAGSFTDSKSFILLR
ncbi:MAG: FG-GAP-like repeat-containing protein, partial [Bacteroidota bacterium]